jgi:predicted alpha/beta superfamily hydrolase
MKSSILLVLIFLSMAASGQSEKNKKTDSAQPFVIGVIDQLPSDALAEKRVLNIYLPEGYNHADTIKYPVIYLLDGSADEDFIHIAGLVQFNSFSWINRLPKSILVGIANIDRKRDFTFPTTNAEDKKNFPVTGHSDKFIAFIEKELQPFIEKKYKGGLSKTIIGQSLGGLLATEILLKKPALFDKYIIISPSLWWDDGALLQGQSKNLQDSSLHRTAVYIGVGKEGLAPTKTPRVMEADANLLAEKIKAAKNKWISVYFDYLPQEDHATILHQAVLNAFRWLHSVMERQHDAVIHTLDPGTQ